MPQKTNILITSAGTRVSLVRIFKTELQLLFPESKVISVDANPEFAPACRVSDGYFKVPLVSDEEYIPTLLKIAKANDVGLIIPTIDNCLLTLSENIEKFKEQSIAILVSETSMVKQFNDKKLTNDFFESKDIAVAKLFSKTNYELPLYIKSINGSSSIDNYIIRQHDELNQYHFRNEKLLFFEYLDHDLHTEYTIDMYFDKNSKLKSLVPRQRLEVRQGEVKKAITKDAFFIPIIWNIFKDVKGFKGCITLQIFVNHATNKIFGIEVNPRFGGGFPLTYLAGANFPKWILQEYLLDGIEIPEFHSWEKNLLMLRYDGEVLIPNFLGA
jgi:carbamoyl-phosphate synthase large subunit